MSANYFGTDLREKGHYFRELYKSGGIDYHRSIDMKQVPFCPYDYPATKDGFVGFYNVNGYSILAIRASCIDTRPGCHTLFFFKSNYTKDEFLDELQKYGHAIEIINKIESMYSNIEITKSLSQPT